MNSNLEITYRNMSSSPTVDHVIREQTEKLEKHCPELALTRVVVKAPSHKHTKGGHFQVTVDLSYPGGEVIADRASNLQHAHEDCASALRDAFRSARAELDKRHARRTAKKRHPRHRTHS